MKNLHRYLQKAAVCFLEAQTRDQAIGILVDNLADEGIVHDKEEFLTAVLEREKIVSTAVGKSVAIPHARLPSYNDFLLSWGF